MPRRWVWFAFQAHHAVIGQRRKVGDLTDEAVGHQLLAATDFADLHLEISYESLYLAAQPVGVGELKVSHGREAAGWVLRVIAGQS